MLLQRHGFGPRNENTLVLKATDVPATSGNLTGGLRLGKASGESWFWPQRFYRNYGNFHTERHSRDPRRSPPVGFPHPSPLAATGTPSTVQTCGVMWGLPPHCGESRGQGAWSWAGTGAGCGAISQRGPEPPALKPRRLLKGGGSQAGAEPRFHLLLPMQGGPSCGQGDGRTGACFQPPRIATQKCTGWVEAPGSRKDLLCRTAWL